jgi:hypothetical protein
MPPLDRKTSRILDSSSGRAWWIVALLVLLAMRSNGTTVAVFHSSTQIVIAADSGFIRTDMIEGTLQPKRFPVCKLHKVGNVFFVSIGGMVDNPATSFSLNSLATSAATKSEGVVSSAERFMKISARPASEAATWVRKHLPSYYSSELKKEYPIAVVFFGFDSGWPTIAIVRFSIKEKGGNRVVATSDLDICPSVKCGELTGIMILGANKAANHYIDDLYRSASSKAEAFAHPVETVKKLVEIEADDDPDNVRRPIDIVTIYPDRHTCDQRGKCDCK